MLASPDLHDRTC